MKLLGFSCYISDVLDDIGISWRNGSAPDSRSGGCVFKSRRDQPRWLIFLIFQLLFFLSLAEILGTHARNQKTVCDISGMDWYLKTNFKGAEKSMHRPGIEPGPPAWQASILPLNHRCLFLLFRLSTMWTSLLERKFLNQTLLANFSRGDYTLYSSTAEIIFSSQSTGWGGKVKEQWNPIKTKKVKNESIYVQDLSRTKRWNPDKDSF